MALSHTDITDWNKNAEAYASTAGVPGDRLYEQFREVLWECLGDVAGQSILELGCGHGWLTQMLSDRNGRVTAIDGSTELLSRAKAACSNARFLCHDLTVGLPKLDGTFDLVVAYMVLMDLPVLDSLFRDVQAVSHPGTRLIMTINHPCFFFADIEQDSQSGSWFRKVTSYLSHETWRIPSFGGHNHYHRPLTFYFETMREAGFLVKRLFEPVPIPAANASAIEFRKEVPIFLLLDAVQGSGSGVPEPRLT